MNGGWRENLPFKSWGLSVVIGFALTLYSGVSVLPADGETGSFDCSALLENANKAKETTRAMLLTVQNNQKAANARRGALGPDTIDEMLGLLADQEKKLTQALSELEALRCPSDLPKK
jgi:hypothetical protein